MFFFFFSSRRRHTRWPRDWSSDVCSSDLNPGGLFTVSRWYAPGEVNETGRLVSLGVATLLASGATEPQRHLFLAAAGNVATLIVTKSPLSPAAVGTDRK